MAQYPKRKPVPTRKPAPAGGDPVPDAPEVDAGDVSQPAEDWSADPKPSPMPLPRWMEVDGQIHDPNAAYAEYFGRLSSSFDSTVQKTQPASTSDTPFGWVGPEDHPDERTSKSAPRDTFSDQETKAYQPDEVAEEVWGRLGLKPPTPEERKKLEQRHAAQAAGLPEMGDRPEPERMEPAKAREASGLDDPQPEQARRPRKFRVRSETPVEQPEDRQERLGAEQAEDRQRVHDIRRQREEERARSEEQARQRATFEKQAREDYGIAHRAGLSDDVIGAAFEAAGNDRGKRQEYLNNAHQLAQQGVPQDRIAQAIRPETGQAESPKAPQGGRGEDAKATTPGKDSKGGDDEEIKKLVNTVARLEATVNELKPIFTGLLNAVKDIGKLG